MRSSNLYLVLLAALSLAVASAAQTFERKPAKQEKARERKKPDGATTLQAVEGEAEEPAEGRITIQQLKQKMDSNEDLIILDLRSNSAYLGSTVKIKGAVRIPPDQIEERMKELPKEKEIITYCS